MATYFAGSQPYGSVRTPTASRTTFGQPLTSVAAYGQPMSSMVVPAQPVTAVAQPGLMNLSGAGLMSSYSTMGVSTTMLAPVVQAAQARSVIQTSAATAVETYLAPQPSAVQYEFRELAADRIVRAQAVYKGDSLQSPDALAPAGVLEAAPIVSYEAAPVAAYEAAPAAFEEAPAATNEMVPTNEVVPAEGLTQDDGGLMDALNETLGSLTRVCILGGTAFKDESSEPLVNALAAGFSAWLADRVVVVTGGMAGVQETFAKGCAQGPAVVNMLPEGQSSNSGVGVDFPYFKDLDERIAYFGQIGDIYICVEGGPGVSKEANAAFSRGAIVLPMMSTGGASGGLFDFPAGALEVSPYASPEQWELLMTKGMPEDTARAVCEMILGMLPREEVFVEQ